MLIYFYIFVMLLIQSALGNVKCGDTYNNSTEVIMVIASLLQGHGNVWQRECSFFIKAPVNHYIIFNFTSFIGFWRRPWTHPHTTSSSIQPTISKSKSNIRLSKGIIDVARKSQLLPMLSQCSNRPKVEIFEIWPKGSERPVWRFCRTQSQPWDMPIVFHSSLDLVKVKFSWRSHHHSSFNLTIHFQQKKDICPFRCADGDCLPSNALVCNMVRDCRDNSDEVNCNSQPEMPKLSEENSSSIILPSSPKVSSVQGDVSGGDMVHIITIVSVVIIVLVVFVCVAICVHRMGFLSGWHQNRELSSSSEHNQLHPESVTNTSSHRRHESSASEVSEVMYVPPDQHLERQLQSSRQHHLLLKSAERAMDLSLPPAIAISEDGEEGYIKGQKNLMRSCDPNLEISRESVRPPPNKCVDNSPPPYRRNSLGKCGLQLYCTRGDTHNQPKCARMVRDCLGNTIQMPMPRCNSLSIPNSKSQCNNHKAHATINLGGLAGSGHKSNSASHIGGYNNTSALSRTLMTMNPTAPPGDCDKPPSYREVVQDDRPWQKK